MAKKMSKLACATLTLHSKNLVRYEDKKGCSCCYRRVYSCRCGSHVEKTSWQDDNGGCCE